RRRQAARRRGRPPPSCSRRGSVRRAHRPRRGRGGSRRGRRLGAGRGGRTVGTRPGRPEGVGARQPVARGHAPLLRAPRIPAAQAAERLRAPAVKRIVLGDCLDVLGGLDAGCARLVYLDPPFNTGKAQERTQRRTVRDPNGDRVGFKGRRYRTEVLGTSAWMDAYDDYLGFLAPRLEAARRALTPDGSLFFHIDPREAHYCKVLL